MVSSWKKSASACTTQSRGRNHRTNIGEQDDDPHRGDKTGQSVAILLSHLFKPGHLLRDTSLHPSKSRALNCSHGALDFLTPVPVGSAHQLWVAPTTVTPALDRVQLCLQLCGKKVLIPLVSHI